MAEGQDLIRWHSPDPRAVFPVASLQPSKSLRKSVAKSDFDIRINTAFDLVIEHCSRRDQADDVWISDEIIAVYTGLHHRGLVHSVETWSGGQLVGGLYGVSIGAAFFGESMFSLQSNASKAAFLVLLDTLKHIGSLVLDTQYLNHFTEQLGAVEISRDNYMTLLSQAIEFPDLFASVQ